MIDPVAFTLFGKEIYWYGIIIATAMLLGIWVACRNTRTRDLKPDNIYDLALLVIPLAVIGARLYYVLFQWKSYYAHMEFVEVFAIWHGGLALYGGVIGGLLGLWIYAKRRKIGFFRLVDVIAPALVLGQAIGRWGNFINQEAYGYAVNNVTWQFFPISVYIEATGRWHLATFFYESMWNFGVFAVLMLYLHGKLLPKKPRVNGEVLVMYLLLYGLGRAWIEGLRTDSLYWGSIRVSQLLSIVFVVGGIVYFVLQRSYAARHPQVLYTPLGTTATPPSDAQLTQTAPQESACDVQETPQVQENDTQDDCAAANEADAETTDVAQATEETEETPQA